MNKNLDKLEIIEDIELHSVVSSNLLKIGYNEQLQKLYVKFHNESIYVYEGVPLQIYEQLNSAPSIGKMFNKEIQKKFPYKKIK